MVSKELGVIESNKPVNGDKYNHKCGNVSESNFLTKVLFLLNFLGPILLIRAVQVPENTMLPNVSLTQYQGLLQSINLSILLLRNKVSSVNWVRRGSYMDYILK